MKFPLYLWSPMMLFILFLWGRGVKLIFSGGYIGLAVAFHGLNVILGLYKCNYSLTVKQELGAATG